MTISPLGLLLAALAGALLGGLAVALRLRGAADRARGEAAGRVAAAEALAENERVRRQDLDREMREVQTQRSSMAEALAVARRDAERSAEEIRRQQEFLETSRKELENSFKALAGAVLEGSTKQFLGFAEERFSRSKAEAEAALESRKQAIQTLLDPLRETMQKLESRTGEIERARIDAYAKIDEQITRLAEETVRLQEKTTTLQAALRGNTTRGRWGEIALRNIVELSGMTEHCDFTEQTALEGGGRPDMVVRLPGRRFIAVDAKAPLNAYLTALEATTEEDRNTALDRHVASLRGHVRDLASRDYAEGLGGKVDLVVLFLPGDPFLAAAFARAPDLQTEALRQKILIATPTTLMALLRTVAIYWQQQSLAENAERIAGAARTLYERAATFTDHLNNVGKGLRGAVEAYNRAVGSLERRLLPMGRQLEEMKVTEQSTRQLELPETVEEAPRQVSPPS